MRRRSIHLFCLAVIVCPGVLASASGLPLGEIRQVLRERLVEPPSDTDLRSLRAEDLDSGLRALDPHARYFTAAAYRSPLLGRETLSGIGAELAFQDGAALLLPFQGGAADRAGVADRSRLLAIDGEEIAGLEPETIAQRLRGEAGTAVLLGLRKPDGQLAQVAVERESFRALDVELVPPDERRVVRIRDFTGGLTRPALLATISFLHDAGAPGHDRKPLIIDLRDAIGGDLYEAFDMASLFLPPGTLLGTLRKRGGELFAIHAPPGAKLAMPLILLIGPGTASAAEIFAGALHHAGRATLIGQKTYGKCSSQTDVRLSDGSVLRYTNREVLLPDGQSCTRIGIRPDITVSDAVLSDLPQLTSLALEQRH